MAKSNDVAKQIAEQTKKAENGKCVKGHTPETQVEKTSGYKLAQQIMLLDIQSQAHRVLKMMSTKDYLASEVAYIREHFVTDSESGLTFKVVESKWASKSDQTTGGVMQRVIKEKTIANETKICIANSVENVVTLFANYRSHFLYAEWCRTAEKKGYMREVRDKDVKDIRKEKEILSIVGNLSPEDLKKLLANIK